ncbi:uncharacterized protein LOC143368891 [Andrena cerasifolii]|uniref:uncharacterized protein LOC143368891 n=1 Tax=Andrena cerasifolii TaxID=2819439 RepID=UPI0040384282
MLDYRLGRNLARVFLEYYKLMGLIPAGLPDQPSTKRSRQSRPRYRVLREPRQRASTRTPAPVHLASIQEYFQEETERPASGGCRSMSGTRMSQLGTGSGSGTGVGGCRNRSYRFRSPGAPLDRACALTRRPAEPRLTIIDFNQLTRGGLELATSKNRAKVARRTAKR